MERYTIFCDGSAEPRAPQKSYCCCAFVVFKGDVDGSEEMRDLRPAPFYKQHGCIGRYPDQTSQTAEYRAVIAALKWTAKNLPIDAEVELRTDSQLVQRQISGQYQCNADHLRPLRDEARQILIGLPNLQIVWVPREQNDPADELTKIATIEARNGVRV